MAFQTWALTFSGAPNQTYQNIGFATTDGSGQGQFTDNKPPVGQGYYRTVSGAQSF